MPELDVDLDMVALELGRLMLKNLALEKALHAERMQAARTDAELIDLVERRRPKETPPDGAAN